MRPTEPWLRQHFKVGSISGKEAAVFCPLHKDSKSPSLYINQETGAWKCHAGCGAGKLVSLCKRMKISPPEQGTAPAPQEPTSKAVMYIPAKTVADAVKRLWAKEGSQAREFLRTRRGLSDATIKKFQLGYYNDAVSIPVFDSEGECVNMRLYDWTGKLGAKYRNFAQGYGERRLWPTGVLEAHDDVILFEGELDCLLAHSLGFDNALTSTGGAGGWEPVWSKRFAGKQVLVCYDIDAAGRRGAAAVKAALGTHAKKCTIVELPITEPSNGDFTDYVRSRRFERAAVHEFFGKVKAREASASASRVRFAGLGAAQPDPGHRLNLRAVVSGKDLTPFNVPAAATVRCVPSDKSSACALCPLAGGSGDSTVEIPITSKVVLRSVMAPDHAVEKAVQDHIGIPSRCPGNRIEVTKTAPLWDLRLSPDVDASDEEGAEGSRRAFSMENLTTNQPYDLNLVSCSDPKTQYSLLHILEAKTSLTSLDAWTKVGKEALLKMWEV